MPEIADTASSKRVLEPAPRLAEALFGLIIVLSFTGFFSVADGGRSGIRKMLLSALGCNLVWGLIDGSMYLLGCLAEKSRNLEALRAVRKSTDPDKGQRLVAKALPPLVASLLKPEELESLRLRLCQLPEPPAHPRLHLNDWVGGIGVVALVFLCTFPVAIPFLLMQNALAALRFSNGIALLLLFLTGYAFGHCTRFRPWTTGLVMVVVGAVLVSVIMVLGG